MAVRIVRSRCSPTDHPRRASDRPELLAGQRARPQEMSTFDLWAIRAIGAIVAVCFARLLAMFLRVFA